MTVGQLIEALELFDVPEEKKEAVKKILLTEPKRVKSPRKDD